MGRISQFALGLLALGWMIVVYVTYYTGHLPLPVPQLRIMANITLDLGKVAVIVLASVACGLRLLSLLHLRPKSLLESVITTSSLGFGALGYLVFALGAVGALNGLLIWVVLLVVVGTSTKEVVALSQAVAREIRSGMAALGESPIWTRLLVVYMIVLLGIGLSRALTPPVAWDALVYHLEVAKTYVAQQRIVPIGDLFYANMPQLAEMLYALGLSMGDDVLPQLLHFVFGCLVLVAVYAIGCLVFSRRTALLAGALVLSIPLVSNLLGWPYVDLVLTFFQLGAIYAFLIWRRTRASGWLVTAAVMIGLALAVKYTAAIMLVCLFLAVLWEGREPRRNWPKVLTRAIGFGLVVAAVAWPFYLKNLLYTGNPIYPFVFGGTGWSELRHSWLMSWYGLGNNPLDYLILPWKLTIGGALGAIPFDATIGPFLLALLPFIAIAGLRNGERFYLLGFATAQLVVQILGSYFLTSTLLQPRLTLIMYPLLGLLAADAILRISRFSFQARSLPKVVYALVGLCLILNLATEMNGFLTKGYVGYLTGQKDRNAYLADTLGDYYRMTEYINWHVPPKAVVATWWEPRGYYLRQPLKVDSTMDAFSQLAIAGAGDPDRIAEQMERDGIEYVLVSQWLLERFRDSDQFPLTQSDLAAFEAVRSRGLQLVHQQGGYALYQIKGGNASP